MLRSLTYSTGLALVLAAPAMAQDHDHDERTLYRVFVGDHDAGRITAFDLDAPDNRWTFETAGQAKLFGVGDGGAIVAVQSDDDAVHFLRSGVVLSSHGDHADIAVSDPAAVDGSLEGPRPFHLVDHRGRVAINFDRGGYAEILDAHDLSEGRIEARRIEQTHAHHGFVAPIGGGKWVTSVASGAPGEHDAAPARIGLQEITEEGEPVGEVATCTAIHGEAFSGAYLAAGCDEGILTVTSGPDGLVTQMIEYSADLPAGQTTGTLLGSRSMQAFLGNYGADGLVVIDPVDEPHLRYVELPFRRVDFTLDPANARFGYVLTEDGTLHKLDLLDGALTESARVTEPYSMDGHWNDPRPRLAMAGEEIVMSDPKAGLVRRIAKDTLEEAGTIAVQGAPYNIAVVGGSGAIHEGDGHDHADHDHDGHDHDHDGGHDHDGHGHDDHDHDDHAGHDHGNHAEHGHSHDPQIYAGYFEDSQIADRPLSDYAGDWQSVYPYLQDGTLDPVWEHKAESGTMTAQEYADYYAIGYRTDVGRITIEGDTVTFYENGEARAGQYEYDGYEVLTYQKGNRGVRFIFRKTAGDEAAPQFIQFSDHGIFPAKADHYHLYWGDDRAALLEELTNWPTYYPSALDADEIVREMLAH